MGAKQTRECNASRRSYSNDNPVVNLSNKRSPVCQTESVDLVREMQSDLQPHYRDVTEGYDIALEGEKWRKKIENLKRSHDAINKAMEKEYDKAVQESCKMFKKSENIDQPCMNLEALVLKCYRENPNQTLMCAKYVNDYKKCVTNKRPTAKVTNP